MSLLSFPAVTLFLSALSPSTDLSISIIEAENVRDVYIGHLAVDGNKGVQAAGTYRGIYFNGTGSSTIEHTYVHDVQDYAIQVGSSYNILIVNNRILNNDQRGVYMSSTINSDISHNIIHNNLGYGILLSGAGETNTVISNNIL